jgi:hypothetical protein
MDAAGIVNAEITPLDATGHSAGVTFFGSSCAPTRIYDADLTSLDAQTRYVFVAAHELGHMVDFWAGDTPVLGHSSVEIEKRATIYGSYFAECWLRLLQRTYGPVAAPEGGSNTPPNVPQFKSRKDLTCALANWGRAERAMREERLRWQAQTWSVQNASTLATSGACRSPWPADAMPARGDR